MPFFGLIILRLVPFASLFSISLAASSCFTNCIGKHGHLLRRLARGIRGYACSEMLREVFWERQLRAFCWVWIVAMVFFLLRKFACCGEGDVTGDNIKTRNGIEQTDGLERQKKRRSPKNEAWT